jgi:putative membrane protein
MAIDKHSHKISSPALGKKLFWSLFILFLVHTAGAIGMAFYDTALFSRMTPYNLVLMFVLLVWNQQEKNKQFLNAFLIAFYVGIVVELIGVNTHKLFGFYKYGDVLGLKFFGVPILIGVNWFIIVFSAYISAGLLLGKLHFNKEHSKNNFFARFLQPLIGASIAVLFDWLMEPVALRLGFWFWNDNMIPIFNYTCWFIFSFLISLSFKVMKVGTTNLFSSYLLGVQTVFFIFLRIFLN